MIRRWMPFSRDVRIILMVVIFAAAGWHIDQWRMTRWEPEPVSWQYESDDPELTALMALPVPGQTALRGDARPSAIAIDPASGGWLRNGVPTSRPEPVLLVDTPPDYAIPHPIQFGHVLALPETMRFGDAVDAINRLARTHDCVFAVDGPSLRAVDGTVPEIPVLQLIWTRRRAGGPLRLCERLDR